MHRRADDRTYVEGMHEAFHLRRSHRWIRQSDVEICFGSMLLKRSGSIHRSERGGTHKRRGLLDDRMHVRGNRDDVMLADKLDEPVKRLGEKSRAACRAQDDFVRALQVPRAGLCRARARQPGD